MLENLSNTSGQPNSVVVIQPGLQVQPVVLVDSSGSAVTISSGGGSVASFLATTTVNVNVSAAAAPGSAQVLTATSSSTATWQNSASGFSNPMTAAGDLIDGGTGGAAQRLAIGTVGEVLTVSAGTVPTWSSVSSFTNPMTTPGDVIYESAGTAPTRLGIGTVAQVLAVSASTLPTWVTPFSNPMTVPGDIIYESSGTAPTRLAGNTSTQKEFLSSQGSGSAASAPTWSVVPGQFLTVPAVYTPSSQVSMAVTGTVMTAFSSANINTGSFTPGPSGSVIVTVSFVGQANTSGIWTAFGLAAHGGVSPIVGPEVIEEQNTGDAVPFNLRFNVASLTAGSAYTFDLLGATSGTSFTIIANSVTSTVPTLGSGGQGSPVITTVQAV